MSLFKETDHTDLNTESLTSSYPALCNTINAYYAKKLSPERFGALPHPPYFASEQQHSIEQKLYTIVKENAPNFTLPGISPQVINEIPNQRYQSKNVSNSNIDIRNQFHDRQFLTFSDREGRV